MNTPVKDNKVDAASILANMNKNKVSVEEEPSKIESELGSTNQSVPVSEEAIYQQYTSTRVSNCLITASGKRINFTNYQFYTKDPDIVAYLDSEIERGLQGFTKGRLLTSEELDPEAAKKNAIIEEFKASQEGREFGNTKNVSERTSALSSDQVASGQ